MNLPMGHVKQLRLDWRLRSNYFAGKQEAPAARYVDRMDHAAYGASRAAGRAALGGDRRGHIGGLWGRAASRGLIAPSHAQIAELRLIFCAPGLQAEIMRAALVDDHPFTLAVAERTGTSVQRDIYPRRVAATVTVAVQVAVNAFLQADPPVPLLPLLRDTLQQLSAGVPVPAVAGVAPAKEVS